jgi:hypothetical protein
MTESVIARSLTANLTDPMAAKSIQEKTHGTLLRQVDMPDSATAPVGVQLSYSSIGENIYALGAPTL